MTIGIINEAKANRKPGYKKFMVANVVISKNFKEDFQID
jgi:hypothetical protein